MDGSMMEDHRTITRYSFLIDGNKVPTSLLSQHSESATLLLLLYLFFLS